MRKILSSSVIKAPYKEPAEGQFKSDFPYVLIQIVMGMTCSKEGTVLDPFAGNGTTGVVVLQNGRNFIGIDANALLTPKLNQRLAAVTENTIKASSAFICQRYFADIA